MKSLLIKNGTIVGPQKNYQADIYIQDGKIHQIGTQLDTDFSTQKIDASNLYVLPGSIDVHTHMDMPVMDVTSCDSFETGSLAAIQAGVTTIIDFANQTKGHSLKEAIKDWQQKAFGKSFCDYGFHVSVNDVNQSVINELDDCIENEGVTSFKTFLAYDSMKLDDQQLTTLAEEVGVRAGLIAAHAEDGDEINKLIDTQLRLFNTHPRFYPSTRPTNTEANAVSKLIDISRNCNVPIYFVHISSKEALAEIISAKAQGVKIFAETCPQYLMLNDSSYDQDEFGESAKYVMAPPLRDSASIDALWEGLASGAVDVVATDHCPFLLAQKTGDQVDFTKIPGGVAGIENRFELLFSEGVKKDKITLNKLVEVTATNPAKIFGLYPQKGTIEVGSDADIMLFNPTYEHVISASTQITKCDYSIYEGMNVTGRCVMTILRGKIAMHRGKVSIQKGFGQFVKRGRPTC
ncbi:MAG: dihydropyrimidinase [Bacteriovoracaceae bacterium]|nr:dihydropyrimidinase [Bacteriovoracaceae bacterium]